MSTDCSPSSACATGCRRWCWPTSTGWSSPATPTADPSGALLADAWELLLGLVVALVVGEHPLLGVELPIGVVDLGVVGTVVGVEALLALLLDLLLVLGVGTGVARPVAFFLPVVVLAVVVLVVVLVVVGRGVAPAGLCLRLTHAGVGTPMG